MYFLRQELSRNFKAKLYAISGYFRMSSFKKSNQTLTNKNYQVNKYDRNNDSFNQRKTNTKFQLKKGSFRKQEKRGREITVTKIFQDNSQYLYNMRKKACNLNDINNQYWQNLLPKLQEPAQQLVRMLLNQNFSHEQIIPKVQNYLKFQTFTFKQGERSDIGCSAVLIAMKNSTCQNLSEYEARIIDFMTLSDTSTSLLDGHMVRQIIKGISDRCGQNIQKNVKQHYKLRFCMTILNNWESIVEADLPLILGLTMQFLKKQGHNFIAKWRFYRLVEVIIDKTTVLIKQFFKTQNHERKIQIICLLNSNYLQHYCMLLNQFQVTLAEATKSLYDFIVRNQYNSRHHHNFNRMLFSMLNNLPYVKIGPKGETIRELLLTFYEKQIALQEYKNEYISTQKKMSRYLLQKLIEDAFFSSFKQLPFQVVNDKFLIVRKIPLEKPLIKDFAWRLFKQREQFYLRKRILNDLLTEIYPEKISPQTQRNLQNQDDNTYVYENEFNYRVWMALQNLGYQFKREQIICQRSIDIVINGNILIEIEGQGHISYLTNEVIAKTGARNYHLLLRGYKLITISIYEYLLNRSVTQLQALLKQKIDLVEKEDAIFVS